MPTGTTTAGVFGLLQPTVTGVLLCFNPSPLRGAPLRTGEQLAVT